MRVLMLCRLYYPHMGGVEKQVAELSNRLIGKGFEVDVVTEKFDKKLKEKEKIDGVNIYRIDYPKIKYLGLLYIWIWFFAHLSLIKKSQLVHAHSVFVWYWPFRLLFFRKPAFVTFHGWEGIYPIPWKNKIIRKVDVLLAWKNIAISDYIEKYYAIRADKISYTAVDVPKKTFFRKDKKRLVYVGRLDEDTGLPLILTALSYLKGFSVDFCGDGPLKKDCERYGKVHGFTDPSSYLARSFICLSPGITSILEAFAYKCLVITIYNNPLKKDYLLMTPFSRLIIVEASPKAISDKIKYFTKYPQKARSYIDESYKWVKTQNWENEINLYLELWGVKGNLNQEN